MKKVYTALLLILLAAMFSVGVYSLADYDATGSVSEKREFVKPEFSVKSLLDGTYIPALEQYYSDTFPGRESLLKANRTLNKFYYYSGSGEDSVLILNQNDSAAQGGESLDAVQKANGQTPQQEPQTPPSRIQRRNRSRIQRRNRQIRRSHPNRRRSSPKSSRRPTRSLTRRRNPTPATLAPWSSWATARWKFPRGWTISSPATRVLDFRGCDRQSGRRHGPRRAHDLAHHAERRRILLA